MRLTAKVVGDILEATLGHRIPMNPHGFELQTTNLLPRRARLQCGSGIAGRSDVWGLVQLPSGTAIALGLDTKTKLVAAVRKFMSPTPPRSTTSTSPNIPSPTNNPASPHTAAPRTLLHHRTPPSPPDPASPTGTAASPHTETMSPEDLRIIRLLSEGINKSDAPYVSTHPYKLTANLGPPEFMQVTFIMRHGGSDELIVRAKTLKALDVFIARNNLRQHPRLRCMMITGPNGDVVEEFRR